MAEIYCSYCEELEDETFVHKFSHHHMRDPKTGKKLGLLCDDCWMEIDAFVDTYYPYPLIS